MYYIAGPMIDPSVKEAQKDYYLIRNEKIAKKLEASGFKIFLPQRDTNQKQTPRKIFLSNIDAIKKSDGVIVLLSDTRGIYLEAGFAKALDKTVIGLQLEETRALGTIVRNFLDHVANNVEELVLLLRLLEKENKRKTKK